VDVRYDLDSESCLAATRASFPAVFYPLGFLLWNWGLDSSHARGSSERDDVIDASLSGPI